MLEECFLALGQLHSIGIAHLDIKPEDILYHQGKVILIDFGISKVGMGVTHPTFVIGVSDE